MSRTIAPQLVARQSFAGDLAVQRGDRPRRLGMADVDAWPPSPIRAGRTPLPTGPARRSPTRRASSTTFSTARIALAVGADLDLRQRLEPLRAVDSAVAVQVDDVLAIGVDRDLSGRENGGRGRLRRRAHSPLSSGLVKPEQISCPVIAAPVSARRSSVNTPPAPRVSNPAVPDPVRLAGGPTGTVLTLWVLPPARHEQRHAVALAVQTPHREVDVPVAVGAPRTPLRGGRVVACRPPSNGCTRPGRLPCSSHAANLEGHLKGRRRLPAPGPQRALRPPPSPPPTPPYTPTARHDSSSACAIVNGAPSPGQAEDVKARHEHEAIMTTAPADPLRAQLVRLLDWEEAHVGFDTAVLGLPVELRGARRRGLRTLPVAVARAPAPRPEGPPRFLREPAVRTRAHLSGRLLAAKPRAAESRGLGRERGGFQGRSRER